MEGLISRDLPRIFKSIFQFIAREQALRFLIIELILDPLDFK